jgi:hypothetical protein
MSERFKTRWSPHYSALFLSGETVLSVSLLLVDSFSSRYATKEFDLHGLTYPSPDNTGGFSR